MRIYNSKKPNLTVAIDADGNWKHINEVESGFACNCFCPHCRSKLKAVNSKPEGESKAHHFAHKSGSDCIWSDESSLHKLAKEVLSEEQKIMLPIINGEFEAKQLEFDNVEQEARDSETGLKPDCVCYYGGQKLWVEFKRTHEVDTRKADKIRNAKIDCIEVDLNICEIDKEAVRKFIVEDSSNRIWVYNSKNQQTKVWKERGVRAEAEYSVYDYIQIKRHIAYDEDACLVNLRNMSPSYDIAAHRFFCVNCGKEVVCVDGCFEHAEKNDKCTDDIYLLNAAKEVIYNSFYSRDKYEVAVPKLQLCENIGKCVFADRNSCLAKQYEKFDLKSVGYKACEKSVKIPWHNVVYDIVFKKFPSLDNAIVVNLSTEDCERDFNTQYRQIEIGICDEDAVMKLSEAIDFGSFQNFKEDSSVDATPDDINAKVYKFSIFKSGKTYGDFVKCTDWRIPRNSQVVHEFVFQYGTYSVDSIRLYSLLLCYEKGYVGCYCKICYFLKHNLGKSWICIRYKKYNTPKNPLEIGYCKCGAFGLDFQLVERLREEFRNVKMFEL